MKQIILIGFLILTNLAFAQVKSEYLLHKANDAFSSKDFATALTLYDQSIKEDKTNMEAVFGRALTKVELKDYEGAKKDFGIILKSNPNHIGALINRGRTYFMMKKYDLAIADYTRALELSPGDKNAFRLRAECYNYAGKIDLAQKDLERILEIDSTDTDAKINLAFCYISKKQFQDAKTLYEQLYQADSTEPYVLSNFGYVKHMLGNSEEGISLISRSLELMPENAYAYKYLAEIYLKMNDIKKACEAINTGLKLGFTNAYGPELENMKKSTCK